MCNEKYLISPHTPPPPPPQPQIRITSDASKLGNKLSKSGNRRTWSVEERKSHSYNVIHNIEERSNIGSDLQGQHDSPVKFNENGEGEVGGGGRYQQPGLNLNQQRKLAITFETKNQDFCRIHAFPPFSLIGRVPWKVNQDHCLMLIIANTSMASHSWFLGLLKNLLLLPTHKELLKDQAGNLNPYVTQNSLRRVEWTTSGRTYLQ